MAMVGLQVVRQLVQLAPTDADKLRCFQDATELVAAQRAAEYPRMQAAP